MYLFNRQIRLDGGQLLDSLDWAARMTEKVNALSETPIALWAPFGSLSARTLSWTSVVQDFAQLETMNAKTLADEGYVALADEGATFGSGDPIDDRLSRLVHIDADGADGQYSRVVVAQAASGQGLASVEVAIEIAEASKAIIGTGTTVASSLSGPYGTIAWFTLFPTIEELQESSEQLAAHPSFAKLVDEKGSKVFAPGSGLTTMWRKAI